MKNKRVKLCRVVMKCKYNCFLTSGPFFSKYNFFEVATFFLFNNHPAKSVFPVLVRIYKIFVIDEAFFFPLFVTKYLFPASLLNIETNSFNTIMQIINPSYTWKNRVKRIKAKEGYSINTVAMVYLLPHF